MVPGGGGRVDGVDGVDVKGSKGWALTLFFGQDHFLCLTEDQLEALNDVRIGPSVRYFGIGSGLARALPFSL